jgi:hypothetical protein
MEWIPISKKLPDDYQVVIVTWVNISSDPSFAEDRDVLQVSIAIRCSTWYWWYPDIEEDLYDDCDNADHCAIPHFIRIVAWTPLPKPYEGREIQNGMDTCI